MWMYAWEVIFMLPPTEFRGPCVFLRDFQPTVSIFRINRLGASAVLEVGWNVILGSDSGLYMQGKVPVISQHFSLTLRNHSLLIGKTGWYAHIDCCTYFLILALYFLNGLFLEKKSNSYYNCNPTYESLELFQILLYKAVTVLCDIQMFMFAQFELWWLTSKYVCYHV